VRFELTPFDLDQLPVPPVDGMRRKATPDEHDAAETSKPSGGERDTLVSHTTVLSMIGRE
jgi:hypothetical protein